jgi:hypothetical protein
VGKAVRREPLYDVLPAACKDAVLVAVSRQNVSKLDAGAVQKAVELGSISQAEVDAAVTASRGLSAELVARSRAVVQDTRRNKKQVSEFAFFTFFFPDSLFFPISRCRRIRPEDEDNYVRLVCIICGEHMTKKRAKDGIKHEREGCQSKFKILGMARGA